MRQVMGAIAVAGLLASCTAQIPDNISRQYTDQVRRMNLIPVYPPREDLQVGDLFYLSDVEGQDDKDVFEYLTTFPSMIGMAEQALRSRVMFTPTGDKSPKETMIGQKDFVNGHIATRQEQGGGDTLPIYVFPEVTARASSTLNAGLLAPLAALGLFFGETTSVKLNFNDVRSYYVPKLQAQGLIKSEICAFLQSSQVNALGPMVNGREAAFDEDLKAYASTKNPVRKKRLLLVTKVYLTRSIDYSYSNARIRALAMREAKAGAKEGAVKIINVVGDADAQAAALAQAAVVDSTQDNLAAGSLSAFGLTVNRTFQQPVAVAYIGQEFDLTGLMSANGALDAEQVRERCKGATLVVKELSPDDGPVLRAMTSRQPPRLQ